MNTKKAQTPANSNPIMRNHIYAQIPVAAAINVLTNKYFFIFLSKLSTMYPNFFVLDFDSNKLFIFS